MSQLILNQQGRPFSDLDAAREKARIMTLEVGRKYKHIQHNNGYAVILDLDAPDDDLVNEFDESEAQDILEVVSEAHESESDKIETVFKQDVLASREGNNSYQDYSSYEDNESSEKRFDGLFSPNNSNSLGMRREPRIGSEPPEARIETVDDCLVDKPASRFRTGNIGSNVDKQETNNQYNDDNQYKWDEKFPPITLRPSFLSFINYYILFSMGAFLYIYPEAVWGTFITQDATIYGNQFEKLLPIMIEYAGMGIVIYAFTMIFSYWYAHKYIIADRHIESRFGIIFRSTSSVAAADVKKARLEQSIAGRMFNYGNVLVATAGTSGDDVIISRVYDPVRIQLAIQERVEAARRYNPLDD